MYNNQIALKNKRSLLRTLGRDLADKTEIKLKEQLPAHYITEPVALSDANR